VASRSIVDAEKGGELEIPEAYNRDVKNSINLIRKLFQLFNNWKNFQRRKSVLQAYSICGW
jgi:hypothetical protein